MTERDPGFSLRTRSERIAELRELRMSSVLTLEEFTNRQRAVRGHHYFPGGAPGPQQVILRGWNMMQITTIDGWPEASGMRGRDA